MFPMTIGEATFRYGPWEIPYAAVLGAGVGTRKLQFGVVHKTLLISYRPAGQAKNQLIRFGLKPDPQGAQLVGAFRSHVNDRWQGESGYTVMKKTLGYSSAFVFGFVAVLVILTFAAVVGWAIFRNRPSTSHGHTDSSSAPR